MNIDARGIKENSLFCNWKNFCRAEPAGLRIKGFLRFRARCVSRRSSSFFFPFFLLFPSFFFFFKSEAKAFSWSREHQRQMTTATRILINYWNRSLTGDWFNFREPLVTRMRYSYFISRLVSQLGKRAIFRQMNDPWPRLALFRWILPLIRLPSTLFETNKSFLPFLL